MIPINQSVRTSTYMFATSNSYKNTFNRASFGMLKSKYISCEVNGLCIYWHVDVTVRFAKFNDIYVIIV